MKPPAAARGRPVHSPRVMHRLAVPIALCALAEPVLRAYAEQDGQRVSGGRGRRRGNEVTFSYAGER